MGNEPCGTAATCVRTIDKDRQCRLGNDRMAMMVAPPRNSCAGPSLLEMLWERLLGSYDKLIEFGDPERWMSEEQRQEYMVQRGTCLGLATAISIIINPYHPDVDAVREELAERYELMGEESSG